MNSSSFVVNLSGKNGKSSWNQSIVGNSEQHCMSKHFLGSSSSCSPTTNVENLRKSRQFEIAFGAQMVQKQDMSVDQTCIWACRWQQLVFFYSNAYELPVEMWEESLLGFGVVK